MIKSLSILNVATYGEKPEVLDNLSKLNFVFGSNGTGKTTISRVIAGAEWHEHCEVNWDDGIKLQTLVYNKDFVDANFQAEIKGVFTLGEENIQTKNKIAQEKLELEQVEQKIIQLKQNLNGIDGVSGKIGELKALENFLKTKCWLQKQKHDSKLKGAFKDYRNSAEKFKNKILCELENNMATIAPQADLEKRAEAIFGETPSKETLIETFNASKLIGHEENSVLSKRVLGKEDVDIAGMYKKLGNSDWVADGRSFYEKNDNVCPFCQQDTSNDFARFLTEYFDETFEVDIQAINELKINYELKAEELKKEINELISKPHEFLNLEKLKSEKQLLDSAILRNIQKLENKKKEPSQLVELDSIANIVHEIETLINEANTNIVQHNKVVHNINQERQALTEQVWKFVLEELKTDISDYKSKKNNLDLVITSLNTQIVKKEDEIKEKQIEIRRLEKQTTSIQPTCDDINAMLRTFGFQGFSLAAIDDMYYKLIRENGEDAQTTLSEGERTFVTFLYFYHLLKGSNSETAITNNRVVVFDDPVSSLDSDVLFIVSSLIRKLFEDVGNNNYIKQIFVLTHNVYFHKEVSFKPGGRVRALNTATFWITRKDGQLSKVIQHASNPIKTSYELLWMAVKDKSNPNLTLQNTLRRILEHYFKILGGINLDDIYKKFDGKTKLICKSLLSWVHDGSHSVHDDLYVSNGDTTIETYLQIFKEIFQKSGHIAHYSMMMGEDSSNEKNISKKSFAYASDLLDESALEKEQTL